MVDYKLEGPDRLIKRYEAAWEDLWQSDIKLEGDDKVQREIRLMIYYLYASARAGSSLSLSPVGLSGWGYNGHVFWNTELCTLHAQLGNPEKAYKVFIHSYPSNGVPPLGILAECAGGRGVSPYFTTGAGGALQTMLFGFGGLRLTDEGLVETGKQLPKRWKELNISIRHENKNEEILANR